MDARRIWQLAESIAPEVIAWRRHLHQYPELSYKEAETAAFVAERLRSMGYQPAEGVGGGYGITADLKGSQPGPRIALRADMDALPITEATGLSYASVRPGVMHACGHDAHTAILLGAAAVLKQVAGELTGAVRFLFQPAEEVPPGGARGMVEAGVLEGVSAVFGLHVGNALPAGQVGLRPGPLYAAADRFQVRLLGRGGHAATPHQTVDPIAMLGTVITSVQQIASRMVNPTESAVVTIGWVRGGEAHNVIPDAVEFGGTLRSFDPAVRELLAGRLAQVIHGVAAAFGGQAEVEVQQGYPVLVNDASATAYATAAAQAVLGRDQVVTPPLGMGGEDFAYYAQARPACFARLGTGTPETRGLPVHNPGFVLDESALTTGVAYLVGLALHEKGAGGV